MSNSNISSIPIQASFPEFRDWLFSDPEKATREFFQAIKDLCPIPMGFKHRFIYASVKSKTFSDVALNFVNEALLLSPNDIKWLEYKAIILMRLGLYQDLEKIINIYPNLIKTESICEISQFLALHYIKTKDIYKFITLLNLLGYKCYNLLHYLHKNYLTDELIEYIYIYIYIYIFYKFMPLFYTISKFYWKV